jgi:type IV pilus assembly protein PilO
MATSSQKATPLFVMLLAGLTGYVAYTGTLIDSAGMSGLAAREERVVAIRDTLSRLADATDSATRELARGTVEDLRRRLDTYRGSLALLRRLVPERNEVPNLLDDISSRGKIRGVTLAQVVPLPLEAGPTPFNTYRYNMSVIGRYDQIGQFLADVASLQRIIVPYDLSLDQASMTSAKALGDTSGSLLEAKFQVRTVVKSSTPEGQASGS